MAESTTERLGLARWTEDSDTFSRPELDSSHENLEEKAAGYLRGTLGSRPAASSANVGFLYEDSDNDVLYWSNGSAWLGPFSAATATDHGDLTGRNDDDHSQYVLYAADTYENRPSAGRAGRIFRATTGKYYFDNGSTWQGPFILQDEANGEIDFDGGKLLNYADRVHSQTLTTIGDVFVANGHLQRLTLTDDITLDIDIAAGQSITLKLIQDGTGGHTVSFTQTIKWDGGTAYVASTAANAIDMIVITYDGTDYLGNIVGQAYA